MRIDSHSFIAGENRSDVSDLMSNLEAGDVIKAKVIEMSPQEATLRLSDGSVIKARISESLDAKPGQTISLSVTSRSENSFVLETVKDALQTTAADTGKLLKILDAVNIKSDDIYLKLAAEFLKYDIKPTSENISEALELMKEPSGLDTEKAVFLAAKNITADKADKTMLAGLLNGDLKLGRLLERLNKTMISQTQSTEMQNIDDSTPVNATLPAAENKMPQQAASAPVKDYIKADSQINAEAKAPIQVSSDSRPSFSQSESVPVRTTENASLSAFTTAVKNSAGGDILQAVTAQDTPANAVTDTEVKQLNTAVAPEIAKTVPDDIKESDSRKAVINEAAPTAQKPSSSDTGSASANKSASPEASDNVRTSVVAADNRDISEKAASIKNRLADEKPIPDYSIEKAAEKIINSIDKLFVKINNQLSSAEIDSANIKEKLSELSDELNNLVKLSDSSQAPNAQAVSAANLINDTAKLLDIFKANNVLYYQIPVKIDNFKSTAELYVMKRQQNKKRIDPHDSVLFLSLDTKNMGRVETILDVKGSNVSISLRSESQAVNDFTRANIKSLYSGLAECGYKLVDIRYSIIGSAALPAEQEKLLTDAIRLKHGKVDFRI